jgi:hypothetical protein
VPLADMPQQPWMAAPEITCDMIDYVGAVDHATAPYVPPAPVHAVRNRRHHGTTELSTFRAGLLLAPE